jgi:uncharacterized membrane protein
MRLTYAIIFLALTSCTAVLVIPAYAISKPLIDPLSGFYGISVIPPIAAALSAFLLAPSFPTVIAYVARTLRTLIGADLTNLKDIPALGAPVVSIGGAGTFDGVFLSGIIAILLV